MLSCRLCGKELINPGRDGTCQCRYCGYVQTIPKFEVDQNQNPHVKLSAFAQAAKLLKEGRFDQANQSYLRLAAEYPTEPEGYWGQLLCQYGVAYQYNPADRSRALICHKPSPTSVSASPIFPFVYSHASAQAAKIYRSEAAAIDEACRALCGNSRVNTPPPAAGAPVVSPSNLPRSHAPRKKKKKALPIIGGIVAGLLLIGVATFFLTRLSQPNRKYNHAVDLLEEGQYQEAQTAFEALDGYKDSEDKIKDCSYGRATKLLDEENYAEALTLFQSLGNYKDSLLAVDYIRAVKLEQSWQGYKAAILFYNSKDFRDAENRSFSLWSALTPQSTIGAGGRHTVALKNDHTVVAIGKDENGECQVSSWTDIIGVSAGYHHTVGIRSDGTAVAIGLNEYGQCEVSSWSNLVSVSAGQNHTVGLRSDGTAVAVGYNVDGQCDISSWSDLVSIQAGRAHTVGLKADGTALSIGWNADGRCNLSAWKDIVAIDLGYHTVGLTADGTVLATGSNEHGECNTAAWSNIVAISAGDFHTVGLRADGTVVAVGLNADGQCNVSTWTDIVAIHAGSKHTIGLKSDGTVVAVGYNKYGQIETGSFSDIVLP